MRLIDEPILQPIYDLETPRMAFGRVAMHWRRRLRGAAACRGRRVEGGGRCAALARRGRGRARSRPALRRFEAARLPIGRRIIERARHLGAYLQATRTEEEQARSGRHSNAQAVIAETAVLDFLEA